MRHALRTLPLAALLALAACGKGITASADPDVSGHWRGTVLVFNSTLGHEVEVPISMQLHDDGGHVTGTQADALDCKFLPTYCFGDFTLAGTHDSERMRLSGISAHGPRWTIDATLQGD